MRARRYGPKPEVQASQQEVPAVKMRLEGTPTNSSRLLKTIGPESEVRETIKQIIDDLNKGVTIREKLLSTKVMAEGEKVEMRMKLVSGYLLMSRYHDFAGDPIEAKAMREKAVEYIVARGINKTAAELQVSSFEYRRGNTLDGTEQGFKDKDLASSIRKRMAENRRKANNADPSWVSTNFPELNPE